MTAGSKARVTVSGPFKVSSDSPDIRRMRRYVLGVCLTLLALSGFWYVGQPQPESDKLVLVLFSSVWLLVAGIVFLIAGFVRSVRERSRAARHG